MTLHVVTGAPCPRKTAYALDRKAEGDLVIDYDLIVEALGGEPYRRCNDLMAMVADHVFAAVLELAVANRKTWRPVDVWVALASPTWTHRVFLCGSDVSWHEANALGRTGAGFWPYAPSGRGPTVINVVSGSPCSGKSTYAREHMSPGDVLLDSDRLALAMGAPRPHVRPRVINEAMGCAMRAGTAALAANASKGYGGAAWIPTTILGAEHRKAYESIGGVIHDMDASREECLERAKLDDRPERSYLAIHEYFDHIGDSNARREAE